MTEVSFGEWLKRQRMGRGLTRDQLAHQIGCASVTLQKIESEERRPSAQIVTRLAEIFEIPKDEQTNFLQYARGDWKYAPGEVTGESPWLLSPKSPRTNLPAVLTALIGREGQLAKLHDYLMRAEIRLVTLIGPPGIGKTRLSIEAARQSLPNFSDGVFFAGLAALDDPKLIAATVRQALGYVENQKLPADQHLMQAIGEKQMLIVLDNCEHLVEDAAMFASRLLSACSHLKILATSREVLHSPGEWLYTVPPLELPETTSQVDIDSALKYPALILFTERARAMRNDFALTAENVQIISSICAELDGLPLAIELVAAQIRLHSPQSLLQKLSDPFVLSVQGTQAVPSRQLTLSHAIGWSYDSLTPDEKTLFAYLSVFSGGFTLPAAKSIFSRYFTRGSISDLITSLLDKSLLQRSPDSLAEVRFTMLVTIQQFALDLLRQMSEEADVRNWHLSYFLDLAEQTDREIHGPAQLKWINCAEDELDNFHAALSWCMSNQKTKPALRLLIGLSEAWLKRDRYHEIRSWFDAIRSLSGIMDYPLLYARLLSRIGQLGWFLGDFDYYESLLEESQAILIRLGVEGEPDLALTLGRLGLLALLVKADNKAARSFCERSLQLHHKHGNQWGMALASLYLGKTLSNGGDDVLALALFEQSLAVFHQLGDLWHMARTSLFLGQLFLRQGHYERARVHFDEQLKIDEGLRFKNGIVNALLSLGYLYRHQGDFGRAMHFYEKSLIMSGEYGDTWNLSNSQWHLGLVALHQNDYQRSRQHFVAYYKSASIVFSREVRGCDFLPGMAAVAAGIHQPERAAKLHGAAQALFETTDYRLQPFDRAEFDRHIQIAEKQLGGTKFEELVSEGYTMTMDQAIAYALEDAGS